MLSGPLFLRDIVFPDGVTTTKSPSPIRDHVKLITNSPSVIQVCEIFLKARQSNEFVCLFWLIEIS